MNYTIVDGKEIVLSYARSNVPPRYKQEDVSEELILKKKLIMVMTAIICISIVCIFLSEKSLESRIMNYINENSNDNEPCTIIMNELTPFDWDRMLIYQVGSSSEEISEILDVEFKDSVDLMSGIIFVKGGKVIYKGSEIYNPEMPNELTYYVGSLFGEEKYGVFTPDNAIFEGIKYKHGDEIVYQLKQAKFNTNH